MTETQFKKRADLILISVFILCLIAVIITLYFLIWAGSWLKVLLVCRWIFTFALTGGIMVSLVKIVDDK